MKTTILLALLTVNQAVCFGQDKVGVNEERIWGRSIITESLGDKNPELLLGNVSQGSEHLIGMFVLTRHSEAEVPHLVVHGHLNKSGEFTPNVSLEVSDREDGDWKVIESSLSKKADLTLTGASYVDKLFVRIHLDLFQPYLGKFKLCRVTLQTGESDIFPMAWLTEKGE